MNMHRRKDNKRDDDEKANGSGEAGRSKINLVNPHTGRLSPKEVDDEELEMYDEDELSRSSSFLEFKPDPLLLDNEQGGGGGVARPFPRPSFSLNDLSDTEFGVGGHGVAGNNNGDRGTGPPRKVHKGGRVRDEVWKHFQYIGNHAWQCSDCTYSLVRPQADRLRKHRVKVHGDVGININGEISVTAPATNDPSGGPQPIPSTSSASSLTSATRGGGGRGGLTMSSFKTNSLTRQLKRIADGLEEVVRLKKMKMGLNPNVSLLGGTSENGSDVDNSRRNNSH